MLERLATRIEQVVNLLAIVCFSIIFLAVLLQIFFRFVLRSPFVWTEELSRCLFIWTCFLGWIIALRRGSHIRVTFFLEMLPAPLKRVVLIGLQCLAVFFLLYLAWFGGALTLRSANVPTVTLFFTWMYVYLAVPVSAVIMLFYTLLDMIKLFQGQHVTISSEPLE